MGTAKLLFSFLHFLVLLVDASEPGERFNRLLAKSRAEAPLKLNDRSFAELTDTPRDHFSLVLLTALPAQLGCQLCREYQPEYNILARSWRKGDKSGKHRTFFGTLDFPDGKDTFQKVRS